MDKLVLLLVLIFLSLDASSANFGNYKYATKADMVWDPAINNLAPPKHWNIMYINGFERRKHTKMWFCTDATNKRVLGKLINGYCYVEWNRKEYKNSSYYLLISPTDNANAFSGAFVQVSGSNNKYEAMLKGITAGVIDAGNYSYHCILQDIEGQLKETDTGYIDTMETTRMTLGKYIPSLNKCWASYNKTSISSSGLKSGPYEPDLKDFDKKLYIPIIR